MCCPYLPAEHSPAEPGPQTSSTSLEVVIFFSVETHNGSASTLQLSSLQPFQVSGCVLSLHPCTVFFSEVPTAVQRWQRPMQQERQVVVQRVLLRRQVRPDMR